MRFRGAAFQVSDLKAARTARNVAIHYDYSIDAIMIFAVVDLILWYFVVRVALNQGKEEKKRLTALNIMVTIVVSACCIALPILHFDEIYKKTGQFSKDTYLAGLVADILGNALTLPEDYSVQVVEEIISSYENNLITNMDGITQQADSPNIVVIMNEAFSDLRVLGDLATDVPVLPFWDSINENAIRGWANVSVLGGTTANSEYEFLSSDSTGMFAGINGIPYSNYFSNNPNYPSMVSALKEQGYETTVFHPYLSSGWNRMQVYRSMGFDNIVFMEDLQEDLETLRLYVSDISDYSYLKNIFNTKDKEQPQFIFNITMQNHGGYTYTGSDFETRVHLAGEAAGKYPQAEQFLSLVKYSDEALEDLLAFFTEYNEPVIVLIFGDHQPTLESEFYEHITGKSMNEWSFEEQMNQYKTPFMIWHNYPTDTKEIGDVSLNYLAALLLENAGLEMSPYQQYTLTQFAEFPVITSLGIKDKEGHLYPNGSTEFSQWVWEYRMLTYNHTVDVEGRYHKFYKIGD